VECVDKNALFLFSVISMRQKLFAVVRVVCNHPLQSRCVVRVYDRFGCIGFADTFRVSSVSDRYKKRNVKCREWKCKSAITRLYY
jgi:hypothetical protein